MIAPFKAIWGGCLADFDRNPEMHHLSHWLRIVVDTCSPIHAETKNIDPVVEGKRMIIRGWAGWYERWAVGG